MKTKRKTKKAVSMQLHPDTINLLKAHAKRADLPIQVAAEELILNGLTNGKNNTKAL